MSDETEIEITGDMTIYEAGEVRDIFSSALAEKKNINVNLSNVSEIDSSGLQLMVSLKNDAGENDLSVQYLSHSQSVIGLLDLFDMTSYFGDPIVLEK